MKSKAISGFTKNTPEKLLLDAGAWFKNFDPLIDTFDSARDAGKLLGATQGGGSFSAIPAIRKIEIDGVKGAVKGLETIDEWAVTMTANVKEVSVDSIKIALATAKAETTENGYTKITARPDIDQGAYMENLTWVGRLSGSLLPVIIVLKNALANSGLTLNTADKAESVVALTLTGHFNYDNLDEVPFEIYYPGEYLSSLVVFSQPSVTMPGFTKITVSPEMAAGNSYFTAVGKGLLLPVLNADVSALDEWDGAIEIEADSGDWIMVIEANAEGKAQRGGTTQVRSND